MAEATRKRLRARFGERVEPWWEGLPEALADLASRWELRLEEPVGRGNTSLVVRCRRLDGHAAVLKVTPEAELARAEARALRSWSSSGRVPGVWGYDARLGALLLEAIPNETPLSELEVDVPLRDITELIAALHRSGVPFVGDGIVSLTDRVEFMFNHWAERHGRTPAVARVVPVERVYRAYDLARTMAVHLEAPVLLHGDLHPGNVLNGGVARGLVAIDPRPCVGDAAFDAVDWVFWPADDPRTWQSRCSELAAALDVQRERLWDWCRVFAAMLAASTAARGGGRDRVNAFLALAP
ncbi:MAG: aminoglycoside phosphotransferase family protein [Acidimicrobiia bacterium]|nr:aminoglycoside phosphotransferase family protein [Acidimicrobiia bacterium]